MQEGRKLISIHAPRAGSDCVFSTYVINPANFNPRSPCGERLRSTSDTPKPRYFNPRSPCGERPITRKHLTTGAIISIHAPRAGSNFRRRLLYAYPEAFQSTLPVRGATSMGMIHQCSQCGFQSTLPVRGATDAAARTAEGGKIFQSTLPVRGATYGVAVADIYANVFQSTLPVRGATRPRRTGATSEG